MSPESPSLAHRLGELPRSFLGLEWAAKRNSISMAGVAPMAPLPAPVRTFFLPSPRVWCLQISATAVGALLGEIMTL